MPQTSLSMPASCASGDEKRESRMLDEIARRRARVLAHRLLLVRERGDHGGALALDEVERRRRLEDLLQQQARAGRERRAERHRDAGRPEERLRGEDAVVGDEAHQLGEAPALDHRRALEVQHALRMRGRARRVDQHAVVGGRDFGDRGVEQRLGHVGAARDQCLPRLGAAARPLACRDTRVGAAAAAPGRTAGRATPSSSSGCSVKSSSRKSRLRSERCNSSTETSAWRRM